MLNQQPWFKTWPGSPRAAETTRSRYSTPEKVCHGFAREKMDEFAIKRQPRWRTRQTEGSPKAPPARDSVPHDGATWSRCGGNIFMNIRLLSGDENSTWIEKVKMVGIAKIPGEGRGWASQKTHCCPTQMRRSQNWEIRIIRLTLERKNPFHLWSQKYLICSKLILKTLNLLGFLARGPVTATGLFSRELWRTRPFKQFQNTLKYT